MHIVIDGYNLIRQSETLRSFDRQNLEKGRSELIARLVAYRKRKKHKITVVFDGWQGGSVREERYRHEGIDIIFSSLGQSADDVIKRIAMRRRGEELLIVTSDRDIALTAERLGNVAIPSPEFETYLTVAEDEESPVDGDEDDDTVNSPKKGPARKRSKRARTLMRHTAKL